jgi:hypothetical protein
MPTVCIVWLPLFCLLMSQISQHEEGVDRLQPHTSEILHHHHGGSVRPPVLTGQAQPAQVPQAAQAPQAAGCQPRAGPSFWAMSVRICT